MKILFSLNKKNQQRQFEKLRWVFPIYLSMYATYLRNQGHIVTWDMPDNGLYDKVITSEKQIDVPFLKLPHADRILTEGKNPKWQANGNFKYLPGTYFLVSNTCWWKRCTFCQETIDNKSYEIRDVNDVIEELKEITQQNYKEAFCDSGTFPMGKWLGEFLSKYGRVSFRRPTLSCNMRMVDSDYARLSDVGFRMVLFGLESANQKTLDRINKGTKEEDIKYIIKAAKAGLEPHIAVMFGYPWETDSDAIRTLRLTWWLLKKGYAKTAQASFYMPPDGKNKESHRKYVKQIYKVVWSPSFWLNKLRDIHDVDDLKYFWRQIKEGMARGKTEKNKRMGRECLRK